MNDTVKDVWTPSEEARLVELQERKRRIMEANMGPVRAIVNEMPQDRDSLVKYLLENADKIREALAPFSVS